MSNADTNHSSEVETNMPTTQPTTVTMIDTKPTTNGHAPRSSSSPPDEDRPAAPLPSPDPRRWWALAIIAVAQFLVIMDTSIIGVALPAIQLALGFAQAEPSWV